MATNVMIRRRWRMTWSRGRLSISALALPGVCSTPEPTPPLRKEAMAAARDAAAACSVPNIL